MEYGATTIASRSTPLGCRWDTRVEARRKGRLAAD
jgi:hypothetical protein